MAQYFEDWSGSTVGQSPTGWSSLFGSMTALVESHVSGPAGRRLSLTPTVPDHCMLAFDAVNADADRADAEVALLIAGPSGNPSVNVATLVGAAARGQSNVTYYTGAFMQSSNSPETRRIFARGYVNNGSGTLNKQGSANPYTVGDLYWLRLRCNGSEISVSLAAAATPETLIDEASSSNSQIASAGAVGINCFSSTPAPYYIYAVGVGTNGDSAPLSAEPPVAIKGVRLSMGDGEAPLSSVSGITALWWDVYPPSGAPDYEGVVSIDAGGDLEIDLDAVTALDLGDYGTLGITKPGAVLPDSRGNLFPVQVVDIAT